jgi:hypothetical protein
METILWTDISHAFFIDLLWRCAFSKDRSLKAIRNAYECRISRTFMLILAAKDVQVLNSMILHKASHMGAVI